MIKNETVQDFRQLINIAERGNPNHIVYKFKENIEIKYKDFKEDVRAMSTALLSLKLENQKIILIGSNRYEWCVSYLAITTGNMCVVPLDRALPDPELEKLIKRSGATAIIFENKHKEFIENILNKKNTKPLIWIQKNLKNYYR